jgi:formylmethanofuran dehydrogenase subunit B
MPCDPNLPMTAPDATQAHAWTCPFCSLLCEGSSLAAADGGSPVGGSPVGGSPVGGNCTLARSASVAHARLPAVPGPLVDGAPAALAAAIATAATRIAGWRQPLFGGLGTDIAGARALYRLAARTEAVCDHADGAALMHGVRAVQDHGQYLTTLGELRSRADLIVCMGTNGVARFPQFFRRIGLGEPGSPCREIVFVGVDVPTPAPAGVSTLRIAGSGDLFADAQQLAALVARQRVRAPDAALAALATRLLAARYAVLVWQGAALPAEGALLVETLNRIVGTLNQTTRAASFGLGGSDGAFSVNQTFTWLSGLPLRTRVSAQGLVHEPRLFDTQRLLAGHAVDGLLWISSFSPERLPPASTLPRVVLGPPAMATALSDADALLDCVFIPVATPGLNAAGHLFRTDGPVVLPVFAVRDDGLPGVASVLTQLCDVLGARA